MNSPYNRLRLVVTGSRTLTAGTNEFDKCMQTALILMDTRRGEFHVDVPHSLLLAQGGADGADKLARTWVEAQDIERVESVTYAANWTEFGRAAGPKRNKRMLVEAKPELVLAFWDGSSPGTKNCLETAVQLGILTLIFPVKGNRICPKE